MSVYFITCREQGVVKIGVAVDPEVRLASLQTAAPAKLKLEATLEGSHNEERSFHARFAKCRLHGEWFAITDELDALIRATGHVTGRDEAIATPQRKTGEELAEESIREEHKVFADHMEWRARMDAGEFA